MGASASSSTAENGSTLAPIFKSMQEKVAFEKIVSTTPALYEDAAYHTVLAAPQLFPQLTQLQMELLTREYGEMLAQNSLKSGNFCVLLRYVILSLPFSCKVVTMTKRERGALAPHQVGAASVDQKPETIDTYLHRAVNALFFVRQFIMRFVERTDACSLLAHFNNPRMTECADAQSSAASMKPETLLLQFKDVEEYKNEVLLADLSKNLAPRFLDALVTVLADYAPNPKTYELHVEVVNTLLVLLSPVVYPRDHSQQTGDLHVHNPFLFMLMKFTSPTRASSVVYRLLRNLIERLPATGSSSVSNATVIAKKMAHEMSLIAMSGLSNLADEQSKFSYFTLEGFGSIAASVFQFPWRFIQYFTTHEKTASPLADRSVLLLLVLLQSCRDSDSLVAANPFREALCGLMDNADLESIKTEKGSHSAQSTQQSDAKLQSGTEKVKLLYSDLFQVIGRYASYETSHLMLYTLLYANPMMLDVAVNKLDVEHLLLPLLETLYHAQSVEPSRLYMLVIVLLTFTQDASFVRTAHTHLVLPAVAWYQEHYMLDVSLGSLLMIIFTRLIYRNITHFQDSFIHVNAFAALSNLARSAENLHMYAAQGIVGLIDLLAKNEAKLVVQMQRVTSDQSDVLAQKRAAYVEFIHLLLGVLSSCLKAKLLPRNPQLIYALLHRADTFGLLQKHSAFVAPVKNSPVWSTLAHFQALVRAKTLPDDVLDADSVLTIIRAECVSLLAAFSASSRTGDMFRSTRSGNDDDASYRYEEEVDPEQFFVPYIWKLIQEQTVDFCWQVDKITLFVPSRRAAATPVVVQ